MNISLSPELEKYIHKKVSSGLYTSASEVIRESLRLMHTYEEIQECRIKDLDHAIDIGMSQLTRGEKISAEESYHQLKGKIEKIAQRKSRAAK